MGKHAPATPDYSQVAKDQGAANLEAAKQQSLMNNPNMYTPYGNQVYTMGPDGRPTLTQTLSPAEQQKLDAKNQAEMGALGLLNKDMPNIEEALMGKFGLSGSVLQGGYAPGTHVGNIQENLDFSGAPAMPVADEAARKAAVDASMREASRFLDPQFAQRQSDLDAMLANQGIVRNPGEPGSAWGKEQANLGRERLQAYSQAEDQAVSQGQQALKDMFGMGMQARQQGVEEILNKGQFHNAAVTTENQIAQALAQLMGNQRAQAYSEYASNRTMPLNMLNALLSSSQINNPTFQATAPTQITPAPLLQGAQMAGQQAAANASAQNALWGSALGALGSAFGGGSLGSIFSMFGKKG
jgi:hypothetical protein